MKLRADHGGSSPGGVLERALRPQPSSRLSTSGAPPEHFKYARGHVVAVGLRRSVPRLHTSSRLCGGAVFAAREGGVRPRVPRGVRLRRWGTAPSPPTACTCA